MDGLLSLGLLLFILIIVLFCLLVRNRNRTYRVERDLSGLCANSESLAHRINALEKEVQALKARAPAGFAGPVPGVAAAEPVSVPVEPRIAPPRAGAPRRDAIVAPSAERPMAMKSPEPIVMPGIQAGPQAIPPLTVPPVQRPSPTLPPPPPPARAELDFEGLVGVKLFSWIAGVALVLAGVFFLRYSIEKGWLVPQIRMAIGILFSVFLLLLCERKAARKYPATANAMDAAAIAILFSTFFAAHALWNIISAPVSFILLILVTALAVLLSTRRDSIFIALLGLLGGFAAPALLSTGEDRPIPLFGYLVLLNAGLAWIAHRKRWPLLNALSLIFTTLYQWAWVVKFLRAEKLPLAIVIFLVFPILSYAALALGRTSKQERDGGLPGRPGLFGQTANASAVLPLAFALFMSAVPAYGEEFGILFGFLFCMDAGLFAISLLRGPESLHAAGGLSTLLVFAIWLKTSYHGGAWPVILPLVALFSLFYLAAAWVSPRLRTPFSGLGVRAAMAAPLLLFAFPALVMIEPRAASPGLFFGVLFPLLGLVAAVAITTRNAALHFLAAFFALAAQAVWSVRYLTPERLLQALAIYTISGLLYIAVPLAACWKERSLKPNGASLIGLPGHIVSFSVLMKGSGYVALAAHVFLLFVAAKESLAVPPWPLLGVLAVLELAIGGAALRLRRSDLHISGLILSSLVLMVLASVAHASPWPGVAMVSAGALVVFSYGWISLARRRGIKVTGFGIAAALAVPMGQAVAMVAASQAGSPGLTGIILYHLALSAAFLWLSWYQRWHFLAILGVAVTALAQSHWWLLHRGMEHWQSNLAFAAPLYLLYSCYPLILGRRTGRLLAPYLAAMIAGVPFFFIARHSLLQGGFENVIGALPIAQAALTVILLVYLLRIEAPGERVLGRLALVAGVALAFVTVAVPLQLEKQWITVGWALEGTALAWLYRRIPHRGLLLASNALLAVVFVRLTLNPEVFEYHARGLPILNWYLYTYLVPAASMLLAGWLFARTDDRLWKGVPGASRLLPGGGTILLFLLLNIEIADFYSTGKTITFNFSATLAQDLTYTLGWALFALALLGVGIAIRNRAARIAAICLLVATIIKCFLHDLARLGGLYLVGSFIGLALCLALVAVLLQKYVLAPKKEIPQMPK